MAAATPVLRWALGAALAGCAALAQADTVGRVLLAAGDAFAVRDGRQVRLAFNSPVESKDVLRTGPASSLQVRFTDEGMISLRENSEFAIDEYRFDGKADGSERGFFHLLKGGFRAVSGLIGRVEHDKYKVRTETSTIGIRGTDYAVRDCRGDCGPGVKNGLYGRVLGLSSGTNQVTLSNNTGEAVFGINENFYVASANTRPQPLLQPPSFVFLRPQGRGRAAQEGGSGTGSEQAGGSSGITGESRPSATTDLALTTPLLTQPFQVTEALGESGTPAALPPPNGFVVAFPFGIGLQGGFGFDDGTIASVTNGQNQLLSYGTLGTFPAGSLGSGSIVDTASLTLPNGQTFTWGRWTGATQVTSSTGLTVSNVPVLFGAASGIQQNNNFVGVVGGSAAYSFAGGPSPVDAAGNVGSVTGSNLTVDFTNLLASYSLSIDFPSVTVSSTNTGSASFSLSGSGVHSSSQGGEFSGGLTGTCSGGGCLSGSASGSFGVGLTGTQGYEFAVVPGVFSGTQAGEVAFLNAYEVSSFTPGPAPVGALTGQVAWSDNTHNLAGTWGLATSDTTYNPSGQPTSFNMSLTGVPAGSIGAGSIVESGSTTLADGGTMNWGRWSGGVIIDPVQGPVTVASGVPFVVGNANTTLPTSGSFVYSLAGGPNVTTSTGGTGGPLSQGAFTIGFGANITMSVSTPLQFTIPAQGTYSLNSLQSVDSIACSGGVCSSLPVGVTHNMVFNGTCSGGTCTTVTSANGTGFLVGPQGAGYAVAGQVFSSGSGPPLPTATFAGAFKHP